MEMFFFYDAVGHLSVYHLWVHKCIYPFCFEMIALLNRNMTDNRQKQTCVQRPSNYALFGTFLLQHFTLKTYFVKLGKPFELK